MSRPGDKGYRADGWHIFKKSRKSKLVKKVDKLSQQMPVNEIKFITLSISATAAATFTYGEALAMVRGTANGTRVGDQIRLIGFETSQSWTNPSITGGLDLCRSMVIVDRETNGVPAVDTEFLAVATTGVTRWHSPYHTRFTQSKYKQKGFRKSYKIMSDKKFLLGALTDNTAGAVAGCPNPSFKIIRTRQKCNIVMTYSGNAGTIADIAQNNVTFAFMSNNAVSNVNAMITGFYIDH